MNKLDQLLIDLERKRALILKSKRKISLIQAAEMIGESPDTLRHYAETGAIASTKKSHIVWRYWFNKKDLLDFIQANENAMKRYYAENSYKISAEEIEAWRKERNP